MSVLKILANLFSIVFHPLLVVTYMLVLLLLVNPYLFGVNDIGNKGIQLLILRVFLSTFLIPIFAILMLRQLGFIQSFQMHDRKERIAPYIITGIFYLSMFRSLLYHPDIPMAFKIFILGATIGLFIAFFINLFSKISMHAVGMGGLVAMIVITMVLFSYESFVVHFGMLGSHQIRMSTLLMAGLLLSGIVCTSRLLLNAHNLQDMYGGFIVGFSTQFIALQVML